MSYDTAQELFDALCMPFPPDAVEWRIGSTTKDKTKALPLCYIDARTVMDRLDTICGPDGWQCNYTIGNNLLICNIGLRMPKGDWLWKADGAGATDVEGEKGMLSDALKRAAVRWGIGRYLYEIKAGWIPIEARGNSHFIPEAEKNKLKLLHEDYAQKAGWGDRAGVYAYRVLRRALDQFVTDAASAQDFVAKNEGMIAQLPVSMRKNLNDALNKIGAEAA